MYIQLGYRGRNAGFITPPAVYLSNDNFLMGNCKMITQSELKKILNYNQETGLFTWAISRGSVKIGDIAGTKHLGYIRIKINKKPYRAHRLAFLWMEGYMPAFVDHDDHIRHNNKWSNLNPATCQENQKNASKRKDNTSGVTGVYWCRRDRKWMAKIRNNGILNNLGSFTDRFGAICTRMSANNKYNFHKNHGA